MGKPVTVALLDLYRGRLSYRRVYALVTHLSDDAAVWRLHYPRGVLTRASSGPPNERAGDGQQLAFPRAAELALTRAVGDLHDVAAALGDHLVELALYDGLPGDGAAGHTLRADQFRATHSSRAGS